MQPKELAASGWERVYGTNMHHAFNLAGRLLAQHPRDAPGDQVDRRRADGAPRGRSREVQLAADPQDDPPHAHAEALKLSRAGVTLNVFMLEDSPGLIGFMERLAELTAGRVFLMDDRDPGPSCSGFRPRRAS